LAVQSELAASAYYVSVACAITVYGLIVALSVRPGVWSQANALGSLTNSSGRR
jgi:hypothetical protein